MCEHGSGTKMPNEVISESAADARRRRSQRVSHLLCPVCGGENIYQTRIVFHGDEEATKDQPPIADIGDATTVIYFLCTACHRDAAAPREDYHRLVLDTKVLKQRETVTHIYWEEFHKMDECMAGVHVVDMSAGCRTT